MSTRLSAALLALGLFLPSLASSAGTTGFQLTDTQGKTYRLSELKGKWVLVNFWTPWCPPCWTELPELSQLQHQHANLIVIGVAMDYLRDDSVQYVTDRYKIDFPVIMGGKSRNQNNASQQIGPVPFYPTSYLYNPDSQISLVKNGIIDRNEIEGLLAGRPAAKPDSL